MPQIQVLRHEPDANAQQISDFATSLSDTLLKKQALLLTSQELKVKAKQAASEMEKVELQRASDSAKDLAAIQEERNPTVKQIMFKNHIRGYYDGDEKKFWENAGMIYPSTEANYKLLKQPEDEMNEAQGRAAKGARDTQEANQLGLTNRILSQQFGDESATPTEGAARGQAVRGGGFRPTQISAGGMTLEDPQAKADVAGAVKMAQSKADLQAELDVLRPVYEQYLNQYQTTVKELGGLPKTNASGAALKGAAASFGANVGDAAQTRAFMKMRGAMALSLGTFMNRGRGSEPDRQAAELMLVSESNPSATNDALMLFTNAIMQAPLKGPGTGTTIDVGESIALKRAAELAQKRFAESGRVFRENAKAIGKSDEEIEATLKDYYNRNFDKMVQQIFKEVGLGQ